MSSGLFKMLPKEMQLVYSAASADWTRKEEE